MIMLNGLNRVDFAHFCVIFLLNVLQILSFNIRSYKDDRELSFIICFDLLSIILF
jgi:hypothetical protein